MPDTFFIIDGHSQIYRAFFARMPDLTSPSGEPTKATYVFLRALLKMLRVWQPTFIAMACDSKRENLLRRKIYPEYKANRPGAPDGFLQQLTRIKQIVNLLGIPVLEESGYEADDIIATLADCIPDGVHGVIVSRDKDLMQLVSKTIRMYDPMMEEWIGYDEVCKKWGVPPEKVVEIQTLIGDTGDNIPGITGIGPIIAAKLIREFGTVENIWEHLPRVKEFHRRLLRESLAHGNITARNRQLVTLNRDVPLRIDERKLQWHGLDLEPVRPIFAELGFRRWE